MTAIQQIPEPSTAEEHTYYNEVQQTPNGAPEDVTYYNTQTSQVPMPNTKEGVHYNEIQENMTQKCNNTRQDTKYDSLILSDKR